MLTLWRYAESIILYLAESIRPVVLIADDVRPFKNGIVPLPHKNFSETQHKALQILPIFMLEISWHFSTHPSSMYLNMRNKFFK